MFIYLILCPESRRGNSWNLFLANFSSPEHYCTFSKFHFLVRSLHLYFLYINFTSSSLCSTIRRSLLKTKIRVHSRYYNHFIITSGLNRLLFKELLQGAPLAILHLSTTNTSVTVLNCSADDFLTVSPW